MSLEGYKNQVADQIVCLTNPPLKMIIKKILNKQNIGEVLRYGVVGGMAVLLHYGIYYLLLRWMDHNIAFTIGYMGSLMANYILSTFFTFKVGLSWKKFIGFTVSHAANYFLQIFLLNFFIWIGLSKVYAPIGVYSISIPFSFLLVRFVLKYKKKS